VKRHPAPTCAASWPQKDSQHEYHPSAQKLGYAPFDVTKTGVTKEFPHWLAERGTI